MKRIIDISDRAYKEAITVKEIGDIKNLTCQTRAKVFLAIKNSTPLEQEPFINKPCVSSGVCEHDKNKVLDEIRAEISDCLKALDEIEKTGLNIYLPNEISGRRLTYKQCLGFIDKYKAESEVEDGNNNH